MDDSTQREMISALMDGQLRGEELARALRTAGTAEGLESWNTYHLIGDVLRSADLAAHQGADAFLARLRTSLHQEARPAALPQAAVVTVVPQQPAANDATFRWKLAAGLASVAAVAAIGWGLVLAPGGANLQPELAKAAPGGQQAVTLAGGERPVMIRDPRLDELLAAHRQFGGTSALQTPSGFLRNATFEGSGR